MGKNEVFDIVKKNLAEIIPGVDTATVMIDRQLKDYGANSIDRMEIVTMSMEALGVTIPLVELAKASNIQELVDILQAASAENVA